MSKEARKTINHHQATHKNWWSFNFQILTSTELVHFQEERDRLSFFLRQLFSKKKIEKKRWRKFLHCWSDFFLAIVLRGMALRFLAISNAYVIYSSLVLLLIMSCPTPLHNSFIFFVVFVVVVVVVLFTIIFIIVIIHLPFTWAKIDAYKKKKNLWRCQCQLVKEVH